MQPLIFHATIKCDSYLRMLHMYFRISRKVVFVRNDDAIWTDYDKTCTRAHYVANYSCHVKKKLLRNLPVIGFIYF